MKPRRLLAFAVVVAAVLAFDQGSKAWARTLPLGVAHPVVAGYWDWQHAENPGAAFSTFVGGDGARVVLSLVAVIAVLAVGYAALRTRPEHRMRRVGYGLVIGGALGNLVDRVRAGVVTDFVHWHVRAHDWPVFNVADVALLLGIACLFLASFAERRKIEA